MRRICPLVVAVTVFSGVAWAALPPLGNSKTTTKTFTSPITSVVADMDAGSLQIRPGSSPWKVTSTEHWLVQEPAVTVTLADGVLTIRSSCPKILVDNCSVDFSVLVPARVTVDASLAAGSIDVARLAGNEKLETSSGSVDVSSISGDVLEASTSAGSVDLSKLHVDQITASSN